MVCYHIEEVAEFGDYLYTDNTVVSLFPPPQKKKKKHWINLRETALKGHWTTLVSFLDFFQKNWDFYTTRSVYLCSDCMLNLTCKFNSVAKIYEFFFQWPFLKVDFLKWLPLSWLLNLAPLTIILVWRKILKLFWAVLWTDTTINWTLCKLLHFGLE